MSQSFSSFNVSPYIGAPFGQPIMLCQGQMGNNNSPKTVRIDIPWSVYGASSLNQEVGVSVNLQTQASVALALDAVRSIFIDNTFSPVPIFVQFPDTLFTVVCPPYAVVMSPVFSMLQQFNVYAMGFALGQAPTTSVFLSNVDRQGFYVPTEIGGETPTNPISLALVDNYTTNYTGNFTIPSIDFGPVDIDRNIVLAISNYWENSAVNISAITIGGIVASQQVSANAVPGGLLTRSVNSQIWIAKVPTGTSGSVTFVLTNSNNVPIQTLMSFYSVIGLTDPPYEQSKQGSNNTPTTITAATDTKKNGCIIACASGSGANLAWNNLAQDAERTITTVPYHLATASYLTTSDSLRTIGVGNANTFASLTLA